MFTLTYTQTKSFQLNAVILKVIFIYFQKRKKRCRGDRKTKEEVFTRWASSWYLDRPVFLPFSKFGFCRFDSILIYCTNIDAIHTEEKIMTSSHQHDGHDSVCLSSVNGVIVVLPNSCSTTHKDLKYNFSLIWKRFIGYLLLGHAGQGKVFWQPQLAFAHFL